ncbi:ORF3 [Seal anellovirus 3]|uniref:ORF3 n=1 Tax=Seal anellovirus 3 TaxID=1427156 RepID=V5NEP8_9VIRU|nr:ORF3 [Seal anellovirus 3]AHA86834.1 ORF3 [Seal anellovirus 3]
MMINHQPHAIQTTGDPFYHQKGLVLVSQSNMTQFLFGFAIASNLRSLETLSTQESPAGQQRRSSVKRQDLSQKYRLAPYSRPDLQTLGTYLQETSTRTASSRMRVLNELLDLIQEDSQPEWKPIRTSSSKDVSDFDTTPGSESEDSDVSYLDWDWEDEPNPGGKGPPLVPPTPGPKAQGYPPHFLF